MCIPVVRHGYVYPLADVTFSALIYPEHTMHIWNMLIMPTAEKKFDKFKIIHVTKKYIIDITFIKILACKTLYTSLLLYEPYANESSQICHFLAVRPQFESVHHQNSRLSSHSYSHESVIFFVFLGLIFVKLRRVCVFWVEMHAARLLQATCSRWNRHCGQSSILR